MRFSPHFWNPWSLTWADFKAQEDNSHPEIQPQKPPVTINNSDFRLAPVLYILLERPAAWKCWEMDNPPWWLTDWLIDWLSRAPPPAPLCSTQPSPLSLCQVSPHRDSPSQPPSRNLRQIPQIPFFSFWWLLHHFCSGFTSSSSQSTEGKAAKWRRFHSSATPQSPVQCFPLTHPNTQNNPFSLLTGVRSHWLCSPYTFRCFPEPLSLWIHSWKLPPQEHGMVWDGKDLRDHLIPTQSYSKPGDFPSETTELGFLWEWGTSQAADRRRRSSHGSFWSCHRGCSALIYRRRLRCCLMWNPTLSKSHQERKEKL